LVREGGRWWTILLNIVHRRVPLFALQNACKQLFPKFNMEREWLPTFMNHAPHPLAVQELPLSSLSVAL
jgi:hypothetical protein